MTVLIALKDYESKRTWLGCDTYHADDTIKGKFGPKWTYLNSHRAIGSAGPIRSVNIVQDNQYELEKMDTPRQIADCLKVKMEEAGYNFGPPQSNGNGAPHGAWPSAYHNFVYVDGPWLYTIGMYFDVLEIKENYVAEGSGYLIASASLATLEHTALDHMSPEDRVRAALHITHLLDSTIHDDGIISFVEWPSE